ncbi:hypothetical protein [Lysobacter gummosus]
MSGSAGGDESRLTPVPRIAVQAFVLSGFRRALHAGFTSARV